MDVLDELGFPPAQSVLGRSSIADLFEANERCGIYILSFSNGEFYAGQAVDVTRRYVQHRKVHIDIEKIAFKEVTRERLNEEERAVIWCLEQNGWPLRNVTFTSIPKGKSDFDLIMPLEDQERWLVDLAFVDGSGERLIDPGMRRKFRLHYKRFLQTPHADSVVSVLNAYVHNGLPAIRRGEMAFWACSCMPKHNVYARVNIYWQEVLTAFTFRNELWFSIHLARSPLEGILRNPLVRFFKWPLSVRHVNHRYEPGGSDQSSFEVPATKAKAFITDPQILSAIRLFNLRLMKKGPCTYGRYHCMDLADRLQSCASSDAHSAEVIQRMR